jgi:hypothetical protein
MENKRGKSNRTDKKSNRFRSVNSSVRGFGTKRDNVIWDHGNAIQWIAAKEILVNKFRSEGVYNRVYHVPVPADFDLNNIEEEKFTKRKPTRIRYVNEKVADLHSKNNRFKDENLDMIEELKTARAIKETQYKVKIAEAKLKHSERAMDIDTVEKNRFESDFEKAKSAYERWKEKFDEETLKTIKFSWTLSD